MEKAVLLFITAPMSFCLVVKKRKRVTRWTRDLGRPPNQTSKWVMEMSGNELQQWARKFAMGQWLREVEVAGQPQWIITSENQSCSLSLSLSYTLASGLPPHCSMTCLQWVHRLDLIWQQAMRRGVMMVWGLWAPLQMAHCMKMIDDRLHRLVQCHPLYGQ